MTPPLPIKNEYPKVTIPDVLREFLHVARSYWKTLTLALLTTTVPVITGGVLVPVFYKHFFDLLTGGSTPESVMPNLLICHL